MEELGDSQDSIDAKLQGLVAEDFIKTFQLVVKVWELGLLCLDVNLKLMFGGSFILH